MLKKHKYRTSMHACMLACGNSCSWGYVSKLCYYAVGEDRNGWVCAAEQRCLWCCSSRRRQFKCARTGAFFFVDILWTMHAKVYGCNAVGRDRSGWAVRSKAALLLVLVAKKQGPQAVKALLPQLLNAAKESPTHTEMVRSHFSILVTNVTLPQSFFSYYMQQSKCALRE